MKRQTRFIIYYFSRVFLTLLYIFAIIPVYTKDCGQIEQDLNSHFKTLETLIASESAQKAYVLSDSLLEILKTRQSERCPISFWIRYYKAESLELKTDFERALLLYYQIIREAEEQKEWEIAAQCYISVARCFEAINRPQDCLRNLQIAKNLIRKYDLAGVESVYAVRYSSYQRLYDDKDTARIFAQLAVESGKKYGVIRSQVDGYLLLGILTKDLQQAHNYFTQATALFIKNNNYVGAAYMYNNIVKRYFTEKQIEKALSAIDTLQIYTYLIPENNVHYYTLLSHIYEIKQNIFEEKNMIDSAYFYLKLSQEFEKKSAWIVNQEKIEENAIEFAIEKEKEKVQYAEKISLMLRIGLAAMTFLLLILIWAMLNIHKKRKQISHQNQIILTNNETLIQSIHKQSVLLSEIHHRVKNNLQVVISLLALKGANSKNGVVRALLEEISTKVKSIALIHDQLYKAGDFEKINLKKYLVDLAANFQELQAENSKFVFDLDCADVFLNLETVLPLGIICSELISNSLKYAIIDDQKLKISISLIQTDKKYLLKYCDNGPGVKSGLEEISQQNMGFSIIQNMVRQLQAESTHYNDQGAVFTIIFEEKRVSRI